MFPAVFANLEQTHITSKGVTSKGVDCTPVPHIAPLNEGVYTFEEKTNDLARNAVIVAVRELEDPDEPIVLMHLGKVLEQFQKWRQYLPAILPHYAVKCNPDKKLIQALNLCGAGFDCATAAEIDLVLSLGVDPKNIVYSNPIKPRSHLRHSAKKSVNLMSFDNESELHKIAKEAPNAELLLRLVCEDKNAQCPMSMKFGASRQQWPVLISLAKDLGLSIAGVSFHVGSGCKEPNAYKTALHDAKEVFALASNLGFDPDVVDIGGGFPGLDNDGDVSFAQIADTISTELGNFFPTSEYPGLKVIAEPGRFFACSTSTLLTKVMARMKIENESEPTSFRYYLNDGLYGSFNCVLYDHAEVSPELLNPVEGPLQKCCLFGPTCDGFDVIIKEHSLPELDEGDHIIWRDMGAYTSAAASKFNGFSKPRVFYYWTTLEAKFLKF